MSHVFQVPDELYERLEAYASHRGRTADELLLAYVEQIARQVEGQGPTALEVDGDDPLAAFAGAFVFGVGDLGLNHDHYLAQALADEHDQSE